MKPWLTAQNEKHVNKNFIFIEKIALFGENKLHFFSQREIASTHTLQPSYRSEKLISSLAGNLKLLSEIRHSFTIKNPSYQSHPFAHRSAHFPRHLERPSIPGEYPSYAIR